MLVFDEGEELAHNLAVRLPGTRLLRVIFGQAYQRSGNLVTLRVNSEEDCARLLKDAPPQVIVYRCSVANGSIEERLARGIEAAYCLSRSLIRTSPKSEIRFLFVHGSDAPPDVAAISALLQTAAEENPKIRVRTVIAEGAGDVLVNEVVRGDGAGEVRYRDGQREMKAFAELSPQNDGIGWFRPKGVYFITGGAGGLGGMFSEHLARNYQARLIWLGRSELATSHLERIEALRARGAEVLYVRGDVTRREEVLEAVRQAKARFGTINGVIHAAGVLRNGFLLNKRIEDLRQVIAAKVYGTLNLDEALTAEPLDAFLLCSSIASVLPEAGQSDYAFANRFLDEFASRREELRARGLRSGRTMAINWQMWRDGGIIAGLSIEELQTRAEQTVHLTGLPALAPEQGIHLLEQSSHMPASSGLFCYGNRKTLLQRIARMYGAAGKATAGDCARRAEAVRADRSLCENVGGGFAEASARAIRNGHRFLRIRPRFDLDHKVQRTNRQGSSRCVEDAALRISERGRPEPASGASTSCGVGSVVQRRRAGTPGTRRIRNGAGGYWLGWSQSSWTSRRVGPH